MICLAQTILNAQTSPIITRKMNKKGYSLNVRECNLAPLSYDLGVKYFNGDGVAQDYKKALQYLNEAAECNYSKTFFLKGLIYEHGLGVKRNIVKAARLYKIASELGDGQASFKLGLLLFSGSGVPKNKQKALELIKTAAGYGFPKAQYYLAKIYFSNKQRMNEGLDLMREAAANNFLFAQNDLAYFLVTQKNNPKEAFFWAQKALRHEPNNPYCNGTMGLVYYKQKNMIKLLFNSKNL